MVCSFFVSLHRSAVTPRAFGGQQRRRKARGDSAPRMNRRGPRRSFKFVGTRTQPNRSDGFFPPLVRQLFESCRRYDRSSSISQSGRAPSPSIARPMPFGSSHALQRHSDYILANLPARLSRLLPNVSTRLVFERGFMSRSRGSLATGSSMTSVFGGDFKFASSFRKYSNVLDANLWL